MAIGGDGRRRYHHFMQGGGIAGMTDGIKLLGVLNRRHDMPLDQFSRHWHEVHGPLALRITRFDRYVQNHRLPASFVDLAPPADGIPMVWLDSLEAGLGLATDPDYVNGARADEPNFMAGPAAAAIVAERTLIPAPRPITAVERLPKAVITFRRRADLSPAAFRAAFLAIERPWFCPPDRLLQCVKSTVLPAFYDHARPPFDAVEELWWPDEHHCLDDYAARRYQPLTALCADDGIRGMRVDERRLR